MAASIPSKYSPSDVDSSGRVQVAVLAFGDALANVQTKSGVVLTVPLAKIQSTPARERNGQYMSDDELFSMASGDWRRQGI